MCRVHKKEDEVMNSQVKIWSIVCVVCAILILWNIYDDQGHTSMIICCIAFFVNACNVVLSWDKKKE
jgi:hypothetical protein